MMNQNLLYAAILYVNSCPVGFIDYCGFIVPNLSSKDCFYCSSSGIVALPYFPKSSNRESVRIVEVPYAFRYHSCHFQWAVENLKKASLCVVRLSEEEIKKRRFPKEYIPSPPGFEKYAEGLKRYREKQKNENLYKDWWKRSDSENADRGLYNGD